MAKGKKKLGGKKNITPKKKRYKGKKKGGKGKNKTTKPKTELEIKLTEQMMKRIRKKPRPLKALQDIYKKLMDGFDRKGLRRPVYQASHSVRKATPTTVPRVTGTSMSTPVGEPANTYHIRRTTMIEKRKGEEDDSPINITTDTVKKCYYLRLTFEGMFDPERRTVITNTDHRVRGYLGGDVLISNGPLFGKYKLENFHLHYGESYDDGTEHSINGRKFTLELHIVFETYSDNVDITEKNFNLTAKKVVLGLMFKLSQKPSYYDLFAVIPHISQKGKSLETSNNLLYDFKEVLSGSEYYNYSGSATEGEYKEYEWMLFRKVLPINKSQMQNMWDLRKSSSVKTNVKPIQPLGERTIFTPYYFDHQKCRGKEVCDCFGYSKIFKPIKTPKRLPIVE